MGFIVFVIIIFFLFGGSILEVAEWFLDVWSNVLDFLMISKMFLVI